MSLIRWSPFEMFSDEARGLIPPVDVYETETAVVVESPVPGVDLDKISVTVADGMLTIRGEDERSSEVDEKNYYRKEIRSGSFHRAVALPAAVNGEKALAEYKDGVLKITIPKEERAKPKQIRISAK